MTRMLDKGTFVGVAILLGAGIAVGVVNNLAAGPTRRLEWSRDWPEKGAPNCPQTLPASGDAPASRGGAPASMPGASSPVAAAAASAPEAAMGAPEAASAAVASGPAATTAVSPMPSAPAPTTAPAPSAIPEATAPAATPPAGGAEVPPVPEGKPWLELTPPQVDALFARNALFVDARLTSQYLEGHVAGAVSIPVWEAGVDEKIAQAVFDVEGDMSRPIVTYCNGGDCEDSHELGRKFSEAGHSAVYVYRDGYPDWLKRGRPVRTGAER